MAKKILFMLASANKNDETQVILDHAQNLQRLGYEVTLALVFMRQDEFNALKETGNDWHSAIRELRFIYINEAKLYKYDVVIFTLWATLNFFEKINGSSYLYFVQSIEAEFYEKHETFMRALVHRTYALGMPMITESHHVQEVMEHTHKARCELIAKGNSNEFAQALEKLTTPPLTGDQQYAMFKTISQSLREQVEVVILKNNEVSKATIETQPLYMGGFFALVIPVTDGNTQIGICFGKKYRHVYIPKMGMEGLNKSQAELNFNWDLNQMKAGKNQIIEALSETGMLGVNITIRKLVDNDDFSCDFCLAFRPITCMTETHRH